MTKPSYCPICNNSNIINDIIDSVFGISIVISYTCVKCQYQRSPEDFYIRDSVFDTYYYEYNKR